MRATVAVGRAAPGVVELQETGFCTCCMATKPLRNVREWSPAFLVDGKPLRTGECAGCGSTIQAARQVRR